MSRSHIISLCLIGTGAITWAFVGRPLVNNSDLKVPLNPLGINGSPYGEVLAMAMQGPIGQYADVGISGAPHNHAAGEECTDPSHDHEGHEGHNHAEGEPCTEDHDDHDHAAAPAQVAKATPSLSRRFGNLLTSLGNLPAVRTNPYAAGEGLKTYLRRQAEDKLRFAYQLDPSHYGNYVVLHFFLTESAVSTRPILTPAAIQLANDTIAYCLKQQDDPRPALTAAAAATNILQLMFTEHQQVTSADTIAQMRQCLDVATLCLARYDAIAAQWDASGNWQRLSTQRFEECQDRRHFVGKIRDTCEQTITRYETETQNQVGR